MSGGKVEFRSIIRYSTTVYVSKCSSVVPNYSWKPTTQYLDNFAKMAVRGQFQALLLGPLKNMVQPGAKPIAKMAVASFRMLEQRIKEPHVDEMEQM